MSVKIGYRIWQFWKSLDGSPGEEEWQKVQTLLSPGELVLFEQLPTPDQNHSLRVYETLEAGGETDLDVMKAALLHDLGKIKHPLKRWERVFAVLVTGLFPRAYLRWGEGDTSGLKHSLVIIKNHPAWGGDLAEEAGSSSRMVWLIRNHENQTPTDPYSENDLKLLRKLQNADNQN
jgi:hypothetical protein